MASETPVRRPGRPPERGEVTLFNQMIGSRRAIVAPIAGTTRDSLAFPVSWERHDVPAL